MLAAAFFIVVGAGLVALAASRRLFKYLEPSLRRQHGFAEQAGWIFTAGMSLKGYYRYTRVLMAFVGLAIILVGIGLLTTTL